MLFKANVFVIPESNSAWELKSKPSLNSEFPRLTDTFLSVRFLCDELHRLHTPSETESEI